MAEPTSKFQPESLDFIARNARVADHVTKILGVSPRAVSGALANEYDTRHNNSLLASWSGAPVQWLGDVFAKRNYFGGVDHEALEESYLRTKDLPLPEGEAGKFWDKFSHTYSPSEIDVGPGNIDLNTAIDLLQDYSTENPDDDPLRLKRYVGHYDRLRDDLLDNEKPEASVAIAGLKIRNADRYFASEDEAAWNRLSPDEQDALRVMYYKMRPDSLSRNIAASKAKAKAEGRQFNFNPYGDGGEQHLNNVDGIKNAMNVGRIQGENVVPYIPEDELVKTPSMRGPVVLRGAWQGPERPNPEFTYDGRAAVSTARGELAPYRGFDTPKERQALERKAPPPSLERLHDKRDALQMWPTRRAPSMTAPPVSGLQRYWQDRMPTRGSLFDAVRNWFE
ncbi:hypothetical protein JVX98_10440 [Ensifer sp. PDNC004]|uniref:hypothetical protein n=1 Tax=unclassified Ensifer TaxID=2633371 RepID=UPI00177B63E0|nr:MULTISPECIES: hypothetical protein [unclassified Ensifer]MBD9647483.1 hypothetical protein [Ensifer sp. ENS09]QRY68662.1 hypothetical protein JVX98_10440 [Ensifer sp. PDNC004]